MFDKPYNFQKVSQRETLSKDPFKKIYYRFKASKRTYFVTLELYSFEIAAIKYCDIKDKDSKNAYTKIFNDGDAIRVVTSCLHIMKDYWAKNPDISFAYYAVLREFKEGLKRAKGKDKPKIIGQYKRARFHIYKYAMINLFPPIHFTQYEDENNCMYVLLNKNQKEPKATLKKLSKYLFDNHDLIFEPSIINN